jgi:cell division protease FtsH
MVNREERGEALEPQRNQSDNHLSKSNSDSSQQGRKPWIYWLFILGAIVIVAYLVWPDPTDRASVTFTSLQQEVEAGNVESITVRGAEVHGSFDNAVRVYDGRVLGPDEEPPADAPRDAVVMASEFESTVPEGGESDFLALLQQEGVEISAEQPGNGIPWWIFLVIGLPVLLIIGFLVMMSRAASGGQQQLFQFTKSKARVSDSSKPATKFADVAGESQAKSELMQVVEFLKHPTKYHRLGAELPRGTLLAGPPGTGKTLMARAVAGEAGVPFYSVSASEFVEMFVGVGAGRVRDLFKNAKEAAPTIIFIDELDAIGRQRFAGVGTGNDEREQTLNQILDEMDGFEAHDDVLVMAATNRPDVLDAALTRPGRFDRQVTLGLPDRRARKDILEVHARKVPLAEDVDLNELARATPGFSGADIANLVNESALVAASKDNNSIDSRDFYDALERIMLGAERPMVLGEEEKRLIAFHEAGHAVVAHHTPGADPLRMISIIPRGQSLGATLQAPSDDRFNYTRDFLIGRLAILMGGRAAESIFLDQMTTGAQNDLKEATQLARRMVGLWGMSDRIGPYYLGLDEEHVFLGREMGQERSVSHELLNRAEIVAQDLVAESMGVATQILRENRHDVELLVERLLEEESLTSEQIDEILGRPEKADREEDPEAAAQVAREPGVQPSANGDS